MGKSILYSSIIWKLCATHLFRKLAFFFPLKDQVVNILDPTVSVASAHLYSALTVGKQP